MFPASARGSAQPCLGRPPDLSLHCGADRARACCPTRGQGGVAEWLRQGPAKPCTPVRFRSPPPREGPGHGLARGGCRAARGGQEHEKSTACPQPRGVPLGTARPAHAVAAGQEATSWARSSTPRRARGEHGGATCTAGRGGRPSSARATRGCSSRQSRSTPAAGCGSTPRPVASAWRSGCRSGPARRCTCARRPWTAISGTFVCASCPASGSSAWWTSRRGRSRRGSRT
jgi:hypothetical protein